MATIYLGPFPSEDPPVPKKTEGMTSSFRGDPPAHSLGNFPIIDPLCPETCPIQSMEFCRPEYWSGKLFPSPGDLPNPGLLHCRWILLPTELPGKPLLRCYRKHSCDNNLHTQRAVQEEMEGSYSIPSKLHDGHKSFHPYTLGCVDSQGYGRISHLSTQFFGKLSTTDKVCEVYRIVTWLTQGPPVFSRHGQKQATGILLVFSSLLRNSWKSKPWSLVTNHECVDNWEVTGECEAVCSSRRKMNLINVNQDEQIPKTHQEGKWKWVPDGLVQYDTWWKVKVKSCLTLCNSMDCSLPGSSVHVILQVRILEWVAISFSSGSPDPGINLLALQADSLPSELPGKPMYHDTIM